MKELNEKFEKINSALEEYSNQLQNMLNPAYCFAKYNKNGIGLSYEKSLLTKKYKLYKAHIIGLESHLSKLN